MIKITVQDVAAHAGVSASTVSRVLNKNHDISPETVATVEAAVAALGYRRGATNRGRRATRVRHAPIAANLALLIPDTNIEAMLTTLSGQLLHGVEEVTRARGFNLLFTRLDEGGEGEGGEGQNSGALPPCLAPGQVRGLIVRSADTAALERLLPNVPLVWVFMAESAPARGDMVQPDNEAAGRMAAEYLLARGHRKVAVFNARPGHAEAQVRAESFVRAMQAAGAEAMSREIAPEALASAIAQAQAGGASGFFLPIGDHATQIAWRTIGAQNIAAGVDLISCNNDAARLRALDARLPNIDIRAAEIGRAAAQTLLWRLENPREHRRTILIEPRLSENGAN